jgi:glucose/arabinose dehydrogenase
MSARLAMFGRVRSAVERALAVASLTLLTSALAPAFQGTVQFAAASSSVGEGGVSVQITVALSIAQPWNTSVPFTVSGTATLGTDFSTSASPLVVPAGALSGVITVNLVQDTLHEGDETVVLQLGVPSGAALGARTAHILTVIDDDPPPAASFIAHRTVVDEISGGFSFRIQLSALSARNATVPFSIAGNASGPGDILAPVSPAVVTAGQLFVDVPVGLVVDRFPELGEQVIFRLDQPMTHATPGAITSLVVLINDGNAGPIALPPALSAVPSALSFPQVRISETTATQQVVITNMHSAPLTFLGLEPESGQVGSFSVSYPGGPVPVTLAPAQSVGVDVRFQPQTAGPRSATFVVRQNFGGFPPSRVVLSGIALGAPGADVVLNVGGPTFVGEDRTYWSGDYGATVSEGVVSSVQPVLGTTDDALYHDSRWGLQLVFALPVPNGTYDVRIRGWEPVVTNVGARVFDVLLEGALAFDDVDYVQLAGPRTAWVSPLHRVQVTDGVLDIDCVPSIGRALVSALEVRAVPVVSSPTSVLNFGTVEQGTFAQRDVEFVNTGLLAGRLTSVQITPGSSGPANEFVVEVGGQQLPGGVAPASFPLDLSLPAGVSTFVPVIFTPTQHRDNDLQLRFTLDGGDPVVVSVFGTGGANAGWGFLHPVIDHDPVIVIDYDNTGGELVALLGAESHTHEPGHFLSGFEWRVDGNLVATTADTSTTLPLGPSTIALTIRDANGYTTEATDSKVLSVHLPSAVPGVLARYYDGSVAGEVFLLDNVPASAGYVARQPGLSTVQRNAFVGDSHFVGDVMVRWSASFSLGSPATLTFGAQGGDDRRVLVDGVLVSGPVALSGGAHSLDVRFAVSDVSDLPLTLSVTSGGVPVPMFEASLTHAEGQLPPVIHTMPTQGIDVGGNAIVIEGFGYFPESLVTVNWGAVSIPPTQFVDYSAERIHIVSPPGSGPIQVSITTPNGTSNAVTFTYSPTGPVPVNWALRLDRQLWVPSPTRGTWGPDGRLWITSIDGSLRAVTYDDNWFPTAAQYYVGVSQLTNKDPLGITFNPYDVYDPNVPSSLKVYIAHGELFQGGGLTPTGPSPFTGQISVLVGPNFANPVALVSGLPVSNHDHSINGLEFDGNGDLLIASGGNTNAGVAWDLIGGIPESPLSGGILKAFTSRPSFNGLVQLRNRVTNLPVDDQRFAEDAVLAPGVDIEVFAPGMRNPFDLLVHTSGAIYATDNGPNVNYGPASLGQNLQGAHPAHPDELLLIERGNYYGHPNRSRSQDDPRQSVYHDDLVPSIPHEFTQKIAHLDSSTNGIEEYRATAFNSQIRGQLVVMKLGGPIRMFALTPDVRGVIQPNGAVLAPYSGGLDVAVAPGGAIFSIDYAAGQVRVQEPVDVAAVGLTPYDVFPARGLTTGGVPFILGGSGFGNLANTSVTFNGVPAVLTQVSARRIKGVVPAQPAGFVGRANVSVTVSANTVVIPLGFQYLPATPGQLPGVWRAGVPLPAGIGEVACAEVGGMLYAFGEGDARTFRFDVANGTWNTALAQRPYPGNHHGCEAWQGRIYLIGGLTGASEGRVQIYDPVTNAWTLGAQMPWAGGSVVTALIEDRIYVGGGIVGSSTVSNFAVYDPAANTWTGLGALPLGVNHAAAATDGLRMFVFGGRQGPNIPQPGFTTVQVFDPAIGSWQTSTAGQVAAMPLPRGGTGRAVWYRGEFFVFGGENATSVFADAQAYDPSTNTWRSDARMPTARHGIFPVVYQDRVFVIGGGVTAGFSASTIVEVFQRP